MNQAPGERLSWMYKDRLSGLQSRAHVEELLQYEWERARREGSQIGLTFFDIDYLGAYNDIFERTAGDACIRRVAGVIAGCYRRGSDIVGRWDGGAFVVLTHHGANVPQAHEHAQIVLARVRSLKAHHPRAGSRRYVTLSAGSCPLSVLPTMTLPDCIALCLSALRRAKDDGRDRVCVAEASELEPPAQLGTGT